MSAHPAACRCRACLQTMLAFAQRQATHFEQQTREYQRRLIAVTEVQRGMRDLADQLAAIEAGKPL